MRTFARIIGFFLGALGRFAAGWNLGVLTIGRRRGVFGQGLLGHRQQQQQDHGSSPDQTAKLTIPSGRYVSNRKSSAHIQTPVERRRRSRSVLMRRRLRRPSRRHFLESIRNRRLVGTKA